MKLERILLREANRETDWQVQRNTLVVSREMGGVKEGTCDER